MHSTSLCDGVYTVSMLGSVSQWIYDRILSPFSNVLHCERRSQICARTAPSRQSVARTP